MAINSVLSAATKRLDGKVALITGGASGIGEYTAKLFANHGAKVIIADVQDDMGQSLCKELGPSSSTYVHCDVTNEAQVQNAVESAMAQYGKLDIMYNNAGSLGSLRRNILDYTLSEFGDVIKVNLVGAFLGTKHAARAMIPARRGSIISTASTYSVMGGVASHAYTSSKHGIVGLMKNTSVELGKNGIRVNCVSPHLISTPLTRKFLNRDDKEISNIYSNLRGQECKVEDVGQATLFLASDDAKFVSGLNLVVDGGVTIMNLGFSMFEEAK